MGTDDSGRGIMAYAGLGLLNAVCLLGGLGGGWAVDSSLNTLPVFMMVGLVVGIALGIVLTRSELRRRF
ncbi:MAG: AtpZ/AtpI family protein [Acidimicrobiales bacterium]